MAKKSGNSATPFFDDAPPAAPSDEPPARGASDAMGEDFSYDINDEADADSSAGGGTEETARYVADMVGALAAMAREARLDLVAYLLDMAHVEAEMQARQSETSVDDD
ncbi:hypothetical protein [Rhodoblastus sp.]|uniref:hypothetical protein n=1 Tax=Rhodoblastus sp. TaxID=1962975 RepID=UPI00262EEC1B|nr:hypothetical protein [Rhodoblastus sp.]